MTSLLVLMVVLVVAVAVLSLVIRARLARKRAEAMRGVAMTVGLSPLDDRADPLPPSVKELPLLNRGHSGAVANALAGTFEGAEVVVFDYRFVTGAGRSQQTHRYTVAAFPGPGGSLPDFELAPESFLTRIGERFGYQDIDFPEDETFSRLYLLRGPDEAAIRSAFGAEVRALLSERPRWCLQARAGCVAAYRSEGLWAPESVPSELSEARRIVAALGR